MDSRKSFLLLIILTTTLFLTCASARRIPQFRPPNSENDATSTNCIYDTLLGFFNGKKVPLWDRLQYRGASSIAVRVLEKSRFSHTAPFVKSLLKEYADQEHSIKWTVFAPDNDELQRFSRNMDEYPAILIKHLVATKVDLDGIDITKNVPYYYVKKVEGHVLGEGFVLVKDDIATANKGTPQSYVNNVEGQSLVITTHQAGVDHKVAMVNGIEIIAPYLYNSDWLVIHGIKGVISQNSADSEL